MTVVAPTAKALRTGYTLAIADRLGAPLHPVRAYGTSPGPANACLPRLLRLLIVLVLLLLPLGLSASTPAPASGIFPPPLESYQDSHLTSLLDVLQHRAQVQPFNLVATLLFLAAVVHTFFTHKLRHWAHLLEDRHQARLHTRAAVPGQPRVSMAARALHFLGEVEVVFGIWVVPLMLAMTLQLGRPTTVAYLNHRVSYNEALFVVVIMTLSATRALGCCF